MADLSQLFPPPPQQQSSLLSDPSKALSALGSITQLLEFSGRRSAAQAFQDAVNPDGTVDRQRFIEGLKSRNVSAGGPGGPAAMLELHNRTIANDTASFEQWAKQNDYAQQWFAARVNQGKPITAEDVLHDVVSASRNSDPRAVPSSVLTGLASSILNDPAGVDTAYRNMAARVMGSGAALSRVQGPPGPGGAPTSVPLVRAGQGTGGQMVTGLPPGSEASAGVMQADLARAGNFAQEIYPLRQALEKATALGPGGMAPGSKGRQEVESFIYGLSPQITGMFGINEKIKNYAELEKYLTQAMQNRAQNLGPHTNEGLATAVTGSPNVHINDLAGVDLIKAAIGMRRMEHSQVLQAAKEGPANYTAAKAGFAAKQDPRAYVIDMMTPDQIKDLQKNLKGPERSRFNASLKAAIDSGAIDGQSREQAKPPVSGARLSPIDNKWYIEDPQRPGKYLRINLPTLQ